MDVWGFYGVCDLCHVCFNVYGEFESEIRPVVIVEEGGENGDEGKDDV